MYDTANNYETAILVSGDSDFAPLIDKMKQKGKKVLVMSTKNHISKELIERAKYIDLKKLKRKIKL